MESGMMYNVFKDIPEVACNHGLSENPTTIILDTLET
jgi:hypothetical protein